MPRRVRDIEAECRVCKNRFVTRFRGAKTAKYCSADCRTKGAAAAVNRAAVLQDRTGIKNPNYRHGKQSGAKKRARMQARRAKRRGLIKPKPCEVCGTTVGVEMHHEDYTKPLVVRWLCVAHHLSETRPKHDLAVRVLTAPHTIRGAAAALGLSIEAVRTAKKRLKRSGHPIQPATLEARR